MTERAAQFSPFAALTGYEDVVWEAGRITERKIELSEDEKAVLDRKQQLICAALERGERTKVTVTYFCPDQKKDGGKYINFSGEIKKIGDSENILTFTDGTEISCSDILDLKQS